MSQARKRKLKVPNLGKLRIGFNVDVWHALVFAAIAMLLIISVMQLPKEPDLYYLSGGGSYILYKAEYNGFVVVVMLFSLLAIPFQIGYLFGKRTSHQNQSL